jgi:hypothetical protein
MFEAIIAYFIEIGQLNDRSAYLTRQFAAYLESQNERTQEMLKKTLDVANYDVLDVDTRWNAFPRLEFWRDGGDYTTTANLNWCGNVGNIEGLDLIVQPQFNFDNWEQISDEEKIEANMKPLRYKIDTERFPISLQNAIGDGISTGAIYYAWMAWNWQEIEGHRCGIKVATMENNSVAGYSLNDFVQDDFTSFRECDQNKKPKRLKAYFPKKLSLEELFLRASQSGYPFNPFKNYWRYFEKDGFFMEYCTYDSAIGVRKGRLSERQTAEIKLLEQHPDARSTLKSLTKLTTDAIFDGWEEKLRPIGLPERMHPRAFNFEIWTGIYWDESERKNQVPPELLKAFESMFQLTLPDAFFEFQRMFNGKINQYRRIYPVDDLHQKKVEQFYSLDEMMAKMLDKTDKPLGLIPIAKLAEGEQLWLCVNKEQADFGRICIQTASNSFKVCDYSFEKSVQYAQSMMMPPAVFAARENDAVLLRRLVEQADDIANSKIFQEAIGEAASSNAYETLELLLQQGLRLRHKEYWKATHIYDAKTISILDKYK